MMNDNVEVAQHSTSARTEFHILQVVFGSKPNLLAFYRLTCRLVQRVQLVRFVQLTWTKDCAVLGWNIFGATGFADVDEWKVLRNFEVPFCPMSVSLAVSHVMRRFKGGN